LDRSRLRGGSGMFDGSRIRGITGSRDTNPPDDAKSGGEAPAYRGGSPPTQRGGEAPPFNGSGANSNSADPGAPAINIPDPIGGSPAADDGPQGEADEPPHTRTARPTWRPYR
jgi:hypothetical protein